MIHGEHATVKWFAEIGHKHVGALEARMDVKFSKKERGAPRCSLEVMARGKGVDAGEELAYCHATLCPTTQICRIKWLGRTNCRPVHQSVRGKRSVVRARGAEPMKAPLEAVDLPGALPGALPEEDEEEEKVVARAPAPKLTVAEALLGVAMTILINFGSDTVELQAMDNGSGKLIQFYRGLGLEALPQTPGEILWMEGSARSVVTALPTYWVDDILPADFDGPSWLQEVCGVGDQLKGCFWFDECRSLTEIRKFDVQEDAPEQSDPVSPESSKLSQAQLEAQARRNSSKSKESTSSFSWSRGKRFLTTLRRPGGIQRKPPSPRSGITSEG